MIKNGLLISAHGVVDLGPPGPAVVKGVVVLKRERVPLKVLLKATAKAECGDDRADTMRDGVGHSRVEILPRLRKLVQLVEVLREAIALSITIDVS